MYVFLFKSEIKSATLSIHSMPKGLFPYALLFPVAKLASGVSLRRTRFAKRQLS
jgi:hypothetical protein